MVLLWSAITPSDVLLSFFGSPLFSYFFHTSHMYGELQGFTLAHMDSRTCLALFVVLDESLEKVQLLSAGFSGQSVRNLGLYGRYRYVN